MLSGLARFEGRSSLCTWTFSILVSRARTRGAREARALPRSPLEGQDAAPAARCLAGCAPGGFPTWTSIDAAFRWDTAPESVVLSKEVLRLLDRALSALPQRQRSVVTMRDVCGMAAEEVCAALGISPANQGVLCTAPVPCCAKALSSTTWGTCARDECVDEWVNRRRGGGHGG
jgi:RNA polymerase sigma-70 factor (ECF subfamily)